MFELALKAKIPFIGVQTDDPVNCKAVLQLIAEKKLMPLPTANAASVGDLYIWFTEDMKAVTVDMYKRLCNSGASAVVLNPDKLNPLIFDAGVLPTPLQFYVDYLKNFISVEDIPPLVQVLQGLSLKAAMEVAQLTMARTGSVLPKDVRRTRMMLGGHLPGLSSLDTDYDFYVMPKVLKEWIDLNDKYFLDLSTPEKLVPRGLLLVGDPGVGKSMASMVLARHWDVPLFRLDISTSLNRYLGESESRIARNLNMIEQNAPCVFLFDEVEKLFGSGDEGTPTRILSQLLWWMQYHKGRVLVVMTSNDISKLPKELYRPGRVDKVIKIEKLTLNEAKLFAVGVYNSVLGVPPTMRRQKAIRDLLDKENKGAMSHAEVSEVVYELIKGKDWLEADQ